MEHCPACKHMGKHFRISSRNGNCTNWCILSDSFSLHTCSWQTKTSSRVSLTASQPISCLYGAVEAMAWLDDSTENKYLRRVTAPAMKLSPAAGKSSQTHCQKHKPASQQCSTLNRNEIGLSIQSCPSNFGLSCWISCQAALKSLCGLAFWPNHSKLNEKM